MENYEVNDPKIERLLKDIGGRLKSAMPPGWGFTLFIFSFGKGGSLFYLSSAQRDDMINTMKEFIKRQEGA